MNLDQNCLFGWFVILIYPDLESKWLKRPNLEKTEIWHRKNGEREGFSRPNQPENQIQKKYGRSFGNM